MKHFSFSLSPFALIIALGIASILTWQCTSPTQSEQFSVSGIVQQIKPAFKNLDVPATHFEMEASTGGKLEMATGTVIHIPANALVDASGQAVTGRVAIDFREFHDAADIMLSGIPMKYDSAGSIYDFQTAGMMEISANQNGSEVFLAQGKEIDVQLASYTPEEGYNLYELSPESKNWGYLGVPGLQENEAKKEGIKLILNSPIPPKPANVREISEAELDQTFDFGGDYSNFPELKAFDGIKWIAVDTKDQSDSSQTNWAFSQVWTEVQLKESKVTQGIYELSLSNQNEQYTIVVQPVVDGKNARQMKKKLKRAMQDYQALMKAREEKLKRFAFQSDVLRAFTIRNFGTFNCDRFYRRPNSIQMAATYQFDEDLKVETNNTLIYMVTADARALLTYNAAPGSSMSFDPTETNKLVAVIGTNRLAVFDQDDFRNANLDAMRNEEKYTFRMRTLPNEINSAKDLKVALGI